MDFIEKLHALKRSLMETRMSGRRRGVGQMVDGIIGAITVIVVVVSIVIMSIIVTNTTITGFTGMNATIAGFLPTLALVGLLVAAAFIGLRAAGVIE